MSKNKQSSIEWLAQQLYEQMEMCGDGGVYDKIIKQAKVLHEQEICQTYIDAIKEYMIDPLEDAMYRIDAEEYYNEKFGGDNNGEITTMGGDNNIPDTNTNTSTTGNILNTWRSHGVNITGNTSDNMWTKTLTNDRNLFENDLWNKTVNWDKNNIEVKTEVNDEEQALYNKTIVVKDGAMETIRVSKPDETNDGTLAVIEITIDIKQR